MRPVTVRPLLAMTLLALLSGCTDSLTLGYDPDVAPEDFTEGVIHPYYPLAPGSLWVYEAESDNGTRTVTVEVLDEPRDINGVPATVVRRTVTLDGEQLEDARLWFAQDRNGTVWRLGEEGTWRWGVEGALPGVQMPTSPAADEERYVQAYQPDGVREEAAVVDEGAVVEVPFGTFEDTITVREWDDGADAATLHYTRGIGLVQREPVDGPVEVLVSYVPG